MTRQQSPNRRTVLRSGSLAFLGVFAGCAGLSTPSARLDLAVYSQTDVDFQVALSLYRSRGPNSRSDAQVHTTLLDVPVNGEQRRKDVAPPRPYVVRYRAWQGGDRLIDEGHIHYYPETDAADPAVSFDITETNVIVRR